MKYLLEDKLHYFRSYFGQYVLAHSEEDDVLHRIDEDTLTNVSERTYLCLHPAESLTDAEVLRIYNKIQADKGISAEAARVWLNVIARDLDAPNASDLYHHLISEGVLVPHENKSVEILLNLGWVKRRQIRTDQ